MDTSNLKKLDALYIATCELGKTLVLDEDGTIMRIDYLRQLPPALGSLLLGSSMLYKVRATSVADPNNSRMFTIDMKGFEVNLKRHAFFAVDSALAAKVTVDDRPDICHCDGEKVRSWLGLGPAAKSFIHCRGCGKEAAPK